MSDISNSVIGSIAYGDLSVLRNSGCSQASSVNIESSVPLGIECVSSVESGDCHAEVGISRRSGECLG